MRIKYSPKLSSQPRNVRNYSLQSHDLKLAKMTFSKGLVSKPEKYFSSCFNKFQLNDWYRGRNLDLLKTSKRVHLSNN